MIDQELRELILEFTDVVYTEDWPDVNRMATDIMVFFLESNEHFNEIDKLLLIISGIENHLNIKNQWYYTELRLRSIRAFTTKQSHDSIIMDHPKPVDQIIRTNRDEYGEINIQTLSEDEIKLAINSCTVNPCELPRVPGQVYRLIIKDDEREYEADFTVTDNGSIEKSIVKWTKKEEESGFNGIWENSLEDEDRS